MKPVAILQLVIVVMLSLLQIATAWDFGGILPWTKWMVSVLLAIMLVLSLPVLWTWKLSRLQLLAPIALVVLGWCFGFFQTVPLPRGLVRFLSPGSHAAYTDWVPESVVGQQTDAAIAISIAPAFTSSYLTLPAVLAATILLAMACVRTNQQVVTFLVLASLSGLMISYLGLADKITGNTSEARFLEPADAAAPFGPFVNRNNAGGYLNLCFGCCLALLVYHSRRQASNLKSDSRYKVDPETQVEKVVGRVREFVRRLDTVSVSIIALAAAIFLGIAACGSRGALVGAIGGMVMALARARVGKRGYPFLLKNLGVALGLGLLVGLISMMPWVQAAYASIVGVPIPEGRLYHWSDSIWAAFYHLPFGSGLGSYRYAYLPYQESGGSSWYVNADGMHVEAFMEAGIFGLLAIAAMLFLLLRTLWLQAQQHSSARNAAVATVAWFAIPSVILTQAFDFGILLVAMLLMLGMIYGALLGTVDQNASASKRKNRSYEDRLKTEEQPKPARFARPALAFTWIVCLLVCWHSISTQKTEAEVDHWVRRLNIWQPEMSRYSEDLREIHASLKQLAETHPTHGPLQFSLARSTLLNNRLATLDATQDVSRSEFRTLWQASNPEFQRYLYFRSPEMKGKWKDTLLPAQDAEEMKVARHAVSRGLRHLPLDDEMRTMLVALDFVEDKIDDSKLLAQQVIQLRKNSPLAQREIALLATVHPGGDFAVNLWGKIVELYPSRLQPIWKNLQDLKSGIALESILPNDATALFFAARYLYEDETQRLRIINKLRGLDESAWAKLEETGGREAMLAQVDVMAGDFDNAISNFEKALEIQRYPILLRIEYAKALALAERFEPAMEEMKKCIAELERSNKPVAHLMSDVETWRRKLRDMRAD